MSQWPLAGDGYTADQVKAVLHSAQQTWGFRYERRSTGIGFNGYLTNVVSCSIQYNSKATVKRTASFEMVEDGNFDYNSDRIQPWAGLRMSDGGIRWFPCGKFTLTSAPRKRDKGGFIHRTIKAYDYAQYAVRDLVSTRYTIASGTKYTDAIATLLSPLLATNVVVPSAATLPATRDWPIGTPRSKILADLLEAINYRLYWLDGMGFGQIMPFVPIDQRTAEYVYVTDSNSVLAPGAEQVADLYSVPNQFTVVVSEPDRSVLSSTYTNTNPLSPTSTASRGATYGALYNTKDAVDQTTLDALAKRIAFEQSQIYETVNLQTLLMPFHGDSDILTLQYADLGISANYVEVSWSMPLKAGALMNHSIQRIISV